MKKGLSGESHGKGFYFILLSGKTGGEHGRGFNLNRLFEWAERGYKNRRFSLVLGEEELKER